MDLVDPTIDFMALAASMGVRASRIGRASDLASAVEDSIATGGPGLIEVRIGG